MWRFGCGSGGDHGSGIGDGYKAQGAGGSAAIYSNDDIGVTFYVIITEANGNSGGSGCGDDDITRIYVNEEDKAPVLLQGQQR